MNTGINIIRWQWNFLKDKAGSIICPQLQENDFTIANPEFSLMMLATALYVTADDTITQNVLQHNFLSDPFEDA